MMAAHTLRTMPTTSLVYGFLLKQEHMVIFVQIKFEA